jgi:Flp pilus assembly protein TadG
MDTTGKPTSETRLPQSAMARFTGLARRLWRDERAAYTIFFALMSPVMIGGVGLASEGGLWLYEHEQVQGAADSAAISAANAYSSNLTVNITSQADAVAASYGYVAGGTTAVTVNRPPLTGTHTNNPNAIQVSITIRQQRLLSSIYSNTPVSITGTAVALAGSGGNGCVMALDQTASAAISAQGSNSVTLSNCSIYDNSSSSTGLSAGGSAAVSSLAAYVVGNVSGSSHFTTTQGLHTGSQAAADPYANVPLPTYSGCDSNNLTIKNTQTISPGVYCGGLQLNAGANVTMQPGVYIMDGGSLQIAGGATLTGTGVTIVFTSHTGSNYANATINGGATVNLTAPTSGTYAGIVFYGDRNMPVGTTFKFNGGSGQVVGGAVYVPKAALQYAGGAVASANCTQVIGDTVTFVGNSVLANNCSSFGTTSIGNANSTLVE